MFWVLKGMKSERDKRGRAWKTNELLAYLHFPQVTGDANLDRRGSNSLFLIFNKRRKRAKWGGQFSTVTTRWWCWPRTVGLLVRVGTSSRSTVTAWVCGRGWGRKRRDTKTLWTQLYKRIDRKCIETCIIYLTVSASTVYLYRQQFFTNLSLHQRIFSNIATRLILNLSQI